MCLGLRAALAAAFVSAAGLLAPAVASGHWTTRIPTRMALAAVLGVLSVLVGLLVSWYAATAAGASVAATALAVSGLSWALRAATASRRPRRVAVPA